MGGPGDRGLLSVRGFSRLRSWYRRRPIAGYEGIEGFLTEREALELYHLATQVPKGGCVVEIGSWKGKSTYCLARGLRKGVVNAIDPFDASGDVASEAAYAEGRGATPLLDQFRSKMGELGVLDRVSPQVGMSRDFAGRFPRIDLLFIDGDHSVEAVDFDYRTFAPSIVPGGRLALHDYYADRGELGPARVVADRVLPSGEYEVERVVDSLWVARRK
jgi:methyltransferase family protein